MKAKFALKKKAFQPPPEQSQIVEKNDEQIDEKLPVVNLTNIFKEDSVKEQTKNVKTSTEEAKKEDT